MDRYRQANRALWNEWAAIHEAGEFYDLAGIREGRITIGDIERREVGDVAGQTLLHLQCHIGTDTVSWARLGARVTGADFSERAIEAARALARDCGVEAAFVCSDIYELPNNLEGTFDVVFTSLGALGWLPDIPGWAKVVSHFLRPGGVFYIHEFHPFPWIFDDDEGATDPRIRYPYFHVPEPLEIAVQGSYADPTAVVRQPVQYAWPYELGTVVTSLIECGLRIEFLHEFATYGRKFLPFMVQRDDGRWWVPPAPGAMPMTFSLRARKERP